MRKFFSAMTVFAAVAALAGCQGGGSEDTLKGGSAANTGTTPTVEIATLDLLTSTPTLPSDGSDTADITALVRDANNNTVEGVSVTFSSDSGSMQVPQPSATGASGTVQATLSVGVDKTNRPITVTATAISGSQTLEATVTVSVIGTQLVIDGPDKVVQGDTATYSVALTDAGGNGIGGQSVNVSSQAGNSLAASSLTTDATGRAQVQMTATQSGDDTITAESLGLSASTQVTVSDDSFAFSSPAADTEVALYNSQTLTVAWQANGAPVSGRNVSFSSTRGTLSASSATTDASGNASVTISSQNAGPAIVTAINADGTSTQLPIEFVATTPASVDVQAAKFSVAPNEQVAITAIVRDANNNLVKNQQVNFSLDDVTGGSLSTASAVTDSQGRAQTSYTASSSTSADGGVAITATVANTAINDVVNLTVAARALFISLGTGNEIFEENSAQYRKEYQVQVTDSQGNGVGGVTVQMSIVSTMYYKGYWSLSLTQEWVRTQTAACADEDLPPKNGVLDPGEDNNNNGKLEAGNIATVVASSGSGGTFVTDANGFGLVDVYYPQEYATWVDVDLSARAAVQGTEFVETASFRLPIAAADVNSADQTPPGDVSPFGISSSCADTN